ncbi:MAG TPA: hypothetical protein VGK31_15135 [Thermoanaerobaculia bacterium]|jgi:hypothetical protein
MKTKKACLTWLAVYVVLAVAIGLIVYRRYPQSGPAEGAAVFGGVVAWMGVAYLCTIPKKIGEAMMIRRARDGEPPRDGERFAAIGRIVANGPTVTSPFTRTPCVAYKYQIRSTGEHDHSLYEGFALTPSTIQTAQGGIRLLAYPDLKVKPQMIPSAEAQPRAEDYIQATSFREATFSNIRDSFAEMMKLFNDDDGSIRFDHRSANQNTALSRAWYYEWIVRPGDQVCAIGHYSAAKHGLVPDPEAPLQHQATVEQGEPDVFVGRSYRGALGYLIGGGIFAGIAAAGLLALYTFVPLSASEEMKPEMNASWPEIRLERLLDKRVRAPLRESGMLHSGTVALTSMPFNSARGRVIAGGREEVPARAVAVRDNDQTTIRIDDDTIVLTIDSSRQPTRLRILGQDITPQEMSKWLDLDITENSAADVAGRLTFLPDVPGRPACRVSFRATPRKELARKSTQENRQ